MSLATAEVQEAILRSIRTEKQAYDYYRYGANLLRDEQARKVFDVLAEEERAHAASFYAIYTGRDIPSLQAFLDTPPDSESAWVAVLKREVGSDFDEKRALELAMEKEQWLEEALTHLASLFDDPTVRKVYEMNARETHNHYLMIEAEYARLMRMVDETDMDTFVRE